MPILFVAQVLIVGLIALVWWAKEQAKTNPWFDKVLKHQLQFEKLWSQARHYRNVISE